MKIIIVFCLISIFTITTTNPIDRQQQSRSMIVNQEQRNKRDLFATTGWGAGGVSYSSFYITGKQVKEMQAAQNKNSKRNTNDPPEEQEEIEIIECKDCTASKKGKETVPQLFSSNGWGPLG